MTYHLLTADAAPLAEDPRTQWRRRLQQRRCLVCGARKLANHNQSYFCLVHIATHRYCSTCETLRTIQEHGKDSRCKACSTARALATNRADPDRNLYRLALKRLAVRRETRGDAIFSNLRRRIALAELVARTPGWTWARRARAVVMDAQHLSTMYRRQCTGQCLDPSTEWRSARAY
jgi:hypothetical protein